MQVDCEITLPNFCAKTPVLGMGALLKSSLCLIKGDKAFISKDHGALTSVEAITAYKKTFDDYCAAAPEAVLAHDLHPDFPSTRLALESGRRTIPIQHHHAHSAAVMAEYGVRDPVIGVTLDGFGLGAQNQAWGGELLLTSKEGFKRIGALRSLPQVGGDVAARDPWRMGAAALWALGRGEEIAEYYKDFKEAPMMKQIMDKGLNAPMTSSAGRLFDAACGLLRVIPKESIDGAAPIELEKIAAAYDKPIVCDSSMWRISEDGGLLVLDMLPTLDRLTNMEKGEGARFFHTHLIAGLSAWIQKASSREGIKAITASGGCFFNRLLRTGLEEEMIEADIKMMLPMKASCGDLGVSLGQAYAAALALEKGI